ncbi:Neprilysin-3 [Gryllus bimaculatus]|nr:Neprilysin-3 [Gryllus bimaculatus]
MFVHGRRCRALPQQFPREKELQNRAAQREASERFNLSRLQDEYGFVQWQPLLEEVFSRNFTDDDVFYVRAPDYMRRLQSMLLHFQRRVVHNALLLLFARDSLWELVDATALASDAGGGGGDGGGDGGGVGVGVGAGAGAGGAGGRYWPGFCARVTVSLFARAASALYLRQISPPGYPEQSCTSGAPPSRRSGSALRLRVNALFPGVLCVTSNDDDDDDIVVVAKHRWPKVHVDPENFFNNVISRYRQMRKIPHDILENPVSEKKWAYPFVVNAFYVRSINSMVIPLAVLTQPTFRADVPRYVPHATVGLLLAHEMVHAFDLAGIAHGADGAPADWFSAPARLRLEARLDCVARQYAAAFTRQVAFLGSSVDVQNMADIAALQVAHSAWRAALAATPDGPDARLPHINLSTRQLFFVAAAQSYCSSLTPEEYIVLVEVDHHTPYPERINGMMMNSPAFAEAFKCPVGSPMNPEKKCAIW